MFAVPRLRQLLWLALAGLLLLQVLKVTMVMFLTRPPRPAVSQPRLATVSTTPWQPVMQYLSDNTSWRDDLERQLKVYHASNSEQSGGSVATGSKQNFGQGNQYLNLTILPKEVCVVVLTGYPALEKSKRLVERLIHQLTQSLPLPRPDMTFKLHLFCEGNCSALSHVHSLMTMYQLSPGVPLTPRSTYKSRKITENYRLMFEALFVQGSEEKCVILEDDLVLAPDALILLSHGHALMEADPTIFTVSLFNDNSFPSFSHNSAAFRRVSHFSGLGFLMSRHWYVTLVKPAWNDTKIWDLTVQNTISMSNMVSIIPEVSRSCHVTDPDFQYGQSIPIPMNAFQSAIGNKVILPKYNFSQLTQNNYDTWIRQMTFHGRSIDYIEDTCFEDGATDLVYWKCLSATKHLNDILTKYHMWGRGNGKMVRGVYKGVLVLPMCKSQVLIVCTDSPFFRNNLVNQRRATFVSGLVGEEYQSLPREAVGLVHHIHTHFSLVLASRGDSCHTACGLLSKQCALEGLWLLNQSCHVIQHMFLECRKCRNIVVKRAKPYTGDMPGLMVGGNCFTGWPHFLTCHASNTRSRRLCTCQ